VKHNNFPRKQGLYDPRFEHDSCGVGFVCNIKGEKTHLIVEQGINVLERLSHRGAVGADPQTGDGAGLLIQIPHLFLEKACKKSNIILPDPGNYGTGMIFLPTDYADRSICMEIFEKVIVEEGQQLLGWRDVPVNNAVIGKGARSTEPFMAQIFIKKDNTLKEQLAFERKLYIIRKQVENTISLSAISQNLFSILLTYHREHSIIRAC